jgi:hypothetical protein
MELLTDDQKISAKAQPSSMILTPKKDLMFDSVLDIFLVDNFTSLSKLSEVNIWHNN